MLAVQVPLPDEDQRAAVLALELHATVREDGPLGVGPAFLASTDMHGYAAWPRGLFMASLRLCTMSIPSGIAAAPRSMTICCLCSCISRSPARHDQQHCQHSHILARHHVMPHSLLLTRDQICPVDRPDCDAQALACKRRQRGRDRTRHCAAVQGLQRQRHGAAGRDRGVLGDARARVRCCCAA